MGKKRKKENELNWFVFVSINGICNWIVGKLFWEFFPLEKTTYCPRDVCNNNVTNVDVPGQRQLFANNAYLNSSSHTTCSVYVYVSFFLIKTRWNKHKKSSKKKKQWQC